MVAPREGSEALDASLKEADEIIGRIRSGMIAKSDVPVSNKGEGDNNLEDVEGIVKESFGGYSGFGVWKLKSVRDEDSAASLVEGLRKLEMALDRMGNPFVHLNVLFSDVCGGDRGSDAIRLDTTDTVEMIEAKLAIQLDDKGGVVSSYSRDVWRERDAIKEKADAQLPAEEEEPERKVVKTKFGTAFQNESGQWRFQWFGGRAGTPPECALEASANGLRGHNDLIETFCDEVNKALDEAGVGIVIAGGPVNPRRYLG